jgi:hypothetical protein
LLILLLCRFSLLLSVKEGECRIEGELCYNSVQTQMILIVSDSVINSRNLLIFLDFLTDKNLVGYYVLRINALNSLKKVVCCSIILNIRKS